MAEPIFDSVKRDLQAKGLKMVNQDLDRPWGGFYVIDEDQLSHFIKTYFPDLELPKSSQGLPMSPKILMVAPHRRLSWQYHHRRSEIWRVVTGPVAIVASPEDQEQAPRTYNSGDLIRIKQGERHRLVGLDAWAVIAEIWVHTDPAQPSDEDDIVRLSDDFDRKSPNLQE